MQRPLSSIINNEALEYALYTIKNRAIPNSIDGLKPVQRFVLYNTIKDASREFNKVAALGSSVSKIGYNHGEVSACDALSSMASDWQNNTPIVEGRGNFGSRMIQECAASRYVYARLHDNFTTHFKDIHLAPDHDDIEHIPPAFYVPIIPMVLINGITGIATGFATNILPHCDKWVKKATIECISGKAISEPVVKFPAFEGTVLFDGEKYVQRGTVSISGLTATVTEIPTIYDHPKYCKILDGLEDSGKISGWVDETSETFQFKVRFKRGTKMDEEFVIKTLKLTKSYTPNINVINQDGKLVSYNDVRDLIKDFVDYRMNFLKLRIKDGLAQSLERSVLSVAKMKFIKDVISGNIVLHGKTRSVLLNELKSNIEFEKSSKELISMSVDKMTDDEVLRLEKDAEAALKEVEYWKSTSNIKEFISDLKILK